ncbi:uncharacterized protein LOC134274798 [Saccostrea cucullata]|uniref:uncharacterized protein LOC134274798 n=1 Tax=Saccostrea cuccullata TaxID=36930 RepID=UPI002ED2C7DA
MSKERGNLSLIKSSDEDGKKIQGRKPKVNDHKDKGHKENKVAEKNPVKKVNYTDIEARQLLTIFSSALDDIKVDLAKSERSGAENVTLSSSQQTLLATEKQKLDTLLHNLKSTEIDCQDDPSKISDLIKQNSLKVVITVNSYGKTVAYYNETSELRRFQSVLKDKTQTDVDKKEEKKTVSRRNRTFGDESDTEARKSPQDNQSYKSQLEWKPSNGSPSSNDSSGSKDTRSTSTSLGEKVEIKQIITQHGITTKLYKGSITRAKVDAVVNAANTHLDNCGGVAEVISKAAGNELEKACRQKMSKRSRIDVAENVVTTGGNLPCRWVIHAVGPRWSDYRNKEEALEDLYRTVVNILHKACERKMESVVMPPISSGIFGVPKQACAAMYVRALLDFAENFLPGLDNKIKEFHIVDIKEDMLDSIFAEYNGQHKNGRSYLEPGSVLKRLEITPWNTGHSWKRSGSDHSNYSNSGSAGNTNIQTRFANKYQAGKAIVKCVSNKTATGSDEFFIGDLLKVLIYKENIIELKNINIIVCAEGREGFGQGYTSKQIIEKENDKYKKRVKKLFDDSKYRNFSDVLQIDSGILHYDLVFFAIIKRFPNSKPQDDCLSLLKRTTLKILEKANKRKTKKTKNKPLSLAMPLLGTGSVKDTQHLQEYADVICNCILEFSKQIKQDTRLREIHLVNSQAPATDALKKAFQNCECADPNSTKQSSPKPYGQNDTRRWHFDPKKYKYEEMWKILEKSEVDFEEFIKACPQKHPVQEETSAISGVKSISKGSSVGNVVLIESSDDEAEPCDTELKRKEKDAIAKAGANTDPKVNVQESEDEESKCIICMDEKMEDPVKLKTCGHSFCRECIKDYFLHKSACPICNTVYGDMFGNQPEGTAKIYTDKAPLPEFSCPTIIIDYDIPDGVQTEEHPNPDVPFTGVSRQAYLPDNEDGRKILGLLKRAFEHRLIFTVGFSRTSGKDNIVTWNDIHHKTRRDGGPEKYGYPDPEYLQRVKEELEAKGITEN